MTEDQIASIQYAADWLSRSEDIGNRKHGERLRALLSASIADTATHKLVPIEPTLEMQYAAIDTGCCTRPTDTYAAMLAAAPEVIADTAGANCATCGAVGTVTSTKARCTLCGMFADTAGAGQKVGHIATNGVAELTVFDLPTGTNLYIADTAGTIDKKAIAWDAHQTCARIPGATHYNAAEIAIDAVLKAITAPPAPSVADAAGSSEPTRWQKAQALFGGGSAAHLPDNIDWTRVMALAEKHGDGWSNEKGWSFHCDDDLFNFAGELAKESGNE